MCPLCADRERGRMVPRSANRRKAMSSVTHTESDHVGVHISLAAALLRELDAAAGDVGMSRSAFVSAAVARMLEDTDDVAVSRARLSDPNDPLISWEQVKAGAGL